MKFSDFIYSTIEFHTWKWSFIFFWGSFILSVIFVPFQLLAYGDYHVPELLKQGMTISLILITIRLLNFKIFTGYWLGYN